MQSKRFLLGWASLVLVVALWLGPLAQAADSPKMAGPKSGGPTPGLELAQTVSMITGVAISPLLGVGAVGAWKYFGTRGEARARLPWFSQPWFWLPALLLVGFCFAKDVAGPVFPTALKKPMDVAEMVENKVSGLVAAGAFVPVAASIFGLLGKNEAMGLSEAGFAAINLAPLWNTLMVPFAVVAFAIVWIVGHAINVLIIISPFATVDAALKGIRLALLGTVVGTSFANPYVGAAWAAVIILLCSFVAGWAFRLTVFGSVFAWDFFTFGRTRFEPREEGDLAFTAREMQGVPIRTLGRVTKGEGGQLTFTYRPWLVLPPRSVSLEFNRPAIGHGFLHPELVSFEEGDTTSLLDWPPRCRTHEETLARIYTSGIVVDVGMMALWGAIKSLFGFGPARAAG